MTTPWQPEHVIDRALVETLLDSQVSNLDLSNLEHVGSGWDHEVWRCGDTVFRFPHQHDALELAADTASIVSRLADRLPFRIPIPTHFGTPTTFYPGRFVGYQYLPGCLPAQLSLTHDERSQAAAPLAHGLKALHLVPRQLAESWGTARASIEGELALRTEKAKLRAAQLASSRFAKLAARAVDAMVPPPPEVEETERRLVHGDLHSGQLIFDRQRQFVGILDWDEVSIGDPAHDLLLVYSFLPKTARARFWSIYGPFSGKARARHLALSYGLAILFQAIECGQDALRDEAAFSLANALVWDPKT